MSDEEESMSEGFSASEDEWKPSKDLKGGESSDDDDSDFEALPLAKIASGGNVSAVRKKGEPKARSASKQTIPKKRTGLSLRAKLYNKYRPPPKTSPTGSFGKNSPTASTSRTNSKNGPAPSESKSIRRNTNDGEDSDSSSGSSIDNYFVKPQDLDINSTFFNVKSNSAERSSVSPVPVFDCNVGLENISDSTSNDEKDENKKDEKSFDFTNLLEYAKSLERAKESVAKYNAEASNRKTSANTNINTLDVYAVLALGEKQQNRSHNDGEDEDDEDDEGLGDEQRSGKSQPSKLSKTKSTRVKRHTKTRPTSTVAASDSDDSDWEEVADASACIDSTAACKDASQIGGLEIHVDLPSRNREKKTQTQQDVENAFKRKWNRDIKERQVMMHKTSLLGRFARTFYYNRLLNDTMLMQKALKLLPSQSAYPPERGTEIKYFQSMVTWFKTTIKLKSKNLYPEKPAGKTKIKAKNEILQQIQTKEARCKQDMIFILIIILRGMGLHCRLVVNMQPIPLKPPKSSLLTIKNKKGDETEDKHVALSANSNTKKSAGSDDLCDAVLKDSASKAKNAKQKHIEKKPEKEADNQHSKNNHIKSVDKSQNIKMTKRKQQDEILEDKQEKNEMANVENPENKERNENKSGSKTPKQTRNRTKKDDSKTNNDRGESKSLSSQANVNFSNPEKKENAKRTQILSEESIQSSKAVKVKNIETAEKKNLTSCQSQSLDSEKNNIPEDGTDCSQKENRTKASSRPVLARLKRTKAKDNKDSQVESCAKKPTIECGTVVIPKIIVKAGKDQNPGTSSRQTRNTRSGSKSPQAHISTAFLLQSTQYKDKFPGIIQQNVNVKKSITRVKSPLDKAKISVDFLTNANDKKRVLRSKQKNSDETNDSKTANIQIPQLDGADDENVKVLPSKESKRKRVNLKKLKNQHKAENSDEDFEPLSPKKQKLAPTLAKRDLRCVSTDSDNKVDDAENEERKQTAGDMWLEVWCDVEEQWACVDIFKAKIYCIDTIRKSASQPLAYVFAFQNDLSIKDVTARYCPNWATVIRKSRVDKAWLDRVISKYLGRPTNRDIKEDQELRRIHEEKPMPTAIGDYKNHPFYALERHLLKFEAIYPPDPPALGYIRKEPVYSRDCVHTLHSREIWLKQARTVKLGEKPYKIVKARPKWDRITQTIIKDQPLEIFGFWQTQDYEPPTAENGLVPRNAYGNVELFKPTMLPKKTKHIRLPGLNRICKKLNIDCANAVVGFDFHQGACHPTFDGFIVCEEFEDQVIAAWHEDQKEQERKEQEKYEARVYGNWKKLIRGLLIRERLKIKYNF